MPRGQPLSNAQRAQIAAEKLTGEATSRVAKRAHVTEREVRRVQHQVRQIKEVNVESRMTEYLDAAFDTLISQVRSQGDPDWLRRQDAQALGVAHGILFDKIVRVLRSIRRGDEPGPGGDGAGAD